MRVAQPAADADLGRADRSGATRSTAGARSIARASSMVRSRGVVVIALAGLKPPVSVRPGSTITRFVPSEENSRTT